MTRATRPLSAPKRSASSDTLAAEGSAAVSTSGASRACGSTPACTAHAAPAHTRAGCTSSLSTVITPTSCSAGRAAVAGTAACICARASTAPIVNSATGDAASASSATVRPTGAHKSKPTAPASAPARIDQGMGLRSTPCSAPPTARATPCSPAAPHCDKPMHSELVTTRSTSRLAITGPIAPSPSRARISGTPMKPELGNAATSAPMAASGQGAPCRRAHAADTATSSSPTASHTPATAGLNSCAAGVLRPKRYSMQGSAKYSTNMFSPATASSGSRRERAAP